MHTKKEINVLPYFTYQNMCRKEEKKDNRARMRTMRQTKKKKKDMAYWREDPAGRCA